MKVVITIRGRQVLQTEDLASGFTNLSSTVNKSTYNLDDMRTHQNLYFWYSKKIQMQTQATMGTNLQI